MAVVATLVACSSNDVSSVANVAPAQDVAPKRKTLDGTAFRRLLANESNRITDIEIRPVGRNTARYIVHEAGKTIQLEADVEYPGPFVDAIAATKVPYRITPPTTLHDWPHSERDMGALDVAGFRKILAAKDTAADIELVFVEPLEDGSARYLVQWKTKGRRDVVVAPFPGVLTPELVAAEIPYGVRLPIE